MVAKTITLPNIKKMFIPDPGYTFYDIDLDQADAQVVAYTADDPELKSIFKRKIDLHLANALLMFKLPFVLDDLLDPEFVEMAKKKWFLYRQKAKVGVHATNYGATSYALAVALGISIKEAQAFIDLWFEIHPPIAKWHERIEEELNTTRTITNAFGASITFYDRADQLFKDALAWEPQSTVGTIINKGILNVHNNMPEVMPLLQVHDSSAGQYPTELESDEFLLRLKDQFEIVVPFDDPLIIGTGLQTSTKSWGDCTDRPWPLAA
jgi:DNA polymerase-1